MGKISTMDTRYTNTLSIKKSIISLCVFLAAVHTFLGAYKMMSKPSDSVYDTVDGFVLTSDVEAHAIDGADASGPTNLFYDAVVRFQYIVNGKTYTNSQILGKVTRNDPTRAHEVMASYSEGKVVRILFDPEAPASSRIDTTSTVLPIPYFLMGIVFVLAAILAHRTIKINTSKGRRSTVRPSQARERSMDTPHLPPAESLPVSKPQSEIAGTWTLDFQIPSMREIIASTQHAKAAGHHDRAAVLTSGKDNLTVKISNHEIEFSYNDDKNQGNCTIVSRYLKEGNILTLEHQSMDFMMVDIEDFPPKSYTYSKKGSKLTLTSSEIRGLGNKKISFHLSLNH